MLKVVVTDQVFPDVELERAALDEVGAELVVADGTRDGALAEAADADALLNTYLPLDAAFFAGLTRCKVVARYGIGVDNVDLDAARAGGVVVTNVPDYCLEEVATHALALILSLVRKVPESSRLLDEGAWGVEQVRPIARLSELTVGLLGYGRIARHLAALMRPTGATVLAHDPYVTEADDGTLIVGFEELLRRSDVLSLHAPLTELTRGIINADSLSKLPDGAVVVNTSRGPLVRMDDLIVELQSGRLRAGLDVFETEPLEPDALRGIPGLIGTPHTAYYSEASLRESQRKAVTQVIKVLSGEPPDYSVNA